MKSATEELNTVAFLGACCMFLSLIEHMIPKPVPFLRIGLANLPVLIALSLCSSKHFFLLVILKVVGQGLIAGTLFSYVFVFSVGGSFASGLLMYVSNRYAGRHFSLIGISVIGSLGSTVAQLLLASALVFGPSARYISPPFLAAGIISGIALGLFALTFIKSSRWYAEESARRRANP